MRYLNKYKTYTNTSIILHRIPSRVLKFKRPKWKRLQLFLNKKSYNSLKIFYNNFTIKSKYRSWDKLKTYFKEGLTMKNALNTFFDNSVSLRYFKDFLKSKSIKNFNGAFYHYFLKLNSRLDILLWKLNFFHSSFQASQAIMSGKILVNNKKVFSKNFFIKEGDIISLNLIDNPQLNSFDSELFFSILEIDYYTKTIIITKNLY